MNYETDKKLVRIMTIEKKMSTLSATSKSTVSMERTSCEHASKLHWISEREKPRRIVAMENSFVGGNVRETASFFFSEATNVNLFTVLWRH